MGSGATKYQEHTQSQFKSHTDFLEYIRVNGAPFTKKTIKRINQKPDDVIHSVIFYSRHIPNDIIISGIKKCLNDGIDVNNHNCTGWTPLHYAAMFNDTNIYNLLISHGADVTAITKKRFSDWNMKDENTVRDIAVYFKSNEVLTLIDTEN